MRAGRTLRDQSHGFQNPSRHGRPRCRLAKAGKVPPSERLLGLDREGTFESVYRRLRPTQLREHDALRRHCCWDGRLFARCPRRHRTGVLEVEQRILELVLPRQTRAPVNLEQNSISKPEFCCRRVLLFGRRCIPHPQQEVAPEVADARVRRSGLRGRGIVFRRRFKERPTRLRVGCRLPLLSLQKSERLVGGSTTWVHSQCVAEQVVVASPRGRLTVRE